VQGRKKTQDLFSNQSFQKYRVYEEILVKELILPERLLIKTKISILPFMYNSRIFRLKPILNLIVPVVIVPLDFFFLKLVAKYRYNF
jgi:hypothetical protein